MSRTGRTEYQLLLMNASDRGRNVKFLGNNFGCVLSKLSNTSKGVFNFNVLAVTVSHILGGWKCTLRGPGSTRAPRAESFFCDQSRYFAISNGIFKFNFLALVDSEITGFPNLH